MISVAHQGLLRVAALISLPIGAAGSVGCMFRVGHRNPSLLLMAMFTGWVLAPFFALAWCHLAARRWTGFARAVLPVVTLVLVCSSLAVYGHVAFGPPRAQPAFFFLVLPAVSLVPLGLIAALRAR